jgi:hypothetical protein
MPDPSAEARAAAERVEERWNWSVDSTQQGSPVPRGYSHHVARALDDFAAEAVEREREEILELLWERQKNEEYGHAKAAVMLDIEAIRARSERGGGE